MKKKTTLPKSNATNANELLDEIAALAREEPKRIRMGCYLETLESAPRGRPLTGIDEWPKCGTVGCIAGWTLVLRGIPPAGINTSGAASMTTRTRKAPPNTPRRLWHISGVFRRKYAQQLKAKAV
jgi:hypothetical protein